MNRKQIDGQKEETQADNRSVNEKAKPKTFKELIAGYEGKHDYEEWDTGRPVGREIF